jgi:hypothetical protein
MRKLNNAICPSADPVSVADAPNSAKISAFFSFVRYIPKSHLDVCNVISGKDKQIKLAAEANV